MTRWTACSSAIGSSTQRADRARDCRSHHRRQSEPRRAYRAAVFTRRQQDGGHVGFGRYAAFPGNPLRCSGRDFPHLLCRPARRVQRPAADVRRAGAAARETRGQDQVSLRRRDRSRALSRVCQGAGLHPSARIANAGRGARYHGALPCRHSHFLL